MAESICFIKNSNFINRELTIPEESDGHVQSGVVEIVDHTFVHTIELLLEKSKNILMNLYTKHEIFHVNKIVKIYLLFYCDEK